MAIHTFVTEIVNQEDLRQELWWRPVDDGVHRPHEGGEAFVVEDDHNRGCWQVIRVVPVFAPAPIRRGVTRDVA